MKELRFALFGAGFWSSYQLAGWREIPGARCVAIYNRTRAKAEKLAEEFDVPAVYDDPAELLAKEELDFVDIVTDVDSHVRFTKMAAERGLAVICQKPLAPTLAEAEEMVRFCEERGVTLLVNENWRWQTPIREFKKVLDLGQIGQVFRGRIDMISGFPVFINQPFFKDLEQFILTDLGSHILDVARFLFGEPTRLYCQTQQVHRDIKGEDVATVMLQTETATVVCELAYAENFVEREYFPQTLIFAEGAKGSAELTGDYWIRTTTSEGTFAKRHAPPRYPWADPAYDVVHSSIVPCQKDLLRHLQGGQSAETTGADNLKTVRLVFRSYDSAASGDTVRL
jgi:predicted dehydrogenase